MINQQRSDSEGKWEACCAIILVNDHKNAELHCHKTFRRVMKAWLVTEKNILIRIQRDTVQHIYITFFSDTFQQVTEYNMSVSVQMNYSHIQKYWHPW